MTSSSLSQEQRQDLAILAGGSADEATESRARHLLADNKEAVIYFDSMQRLTRRIELDLAVEQDSQASEFLSDDRVQALAVQIRKRAADTRWIQRPWMLAAAVLVMIGAGFAVSRPLMRSRQFVAVHLFPLPGQLTGAASDSWLQLRPGQTLTTRSEMGWLTLSAKRILVIGPESSLQYDPHSITLLKGSCFVSALDAVVKAGDSRIQVAGETLISAQGDGIFVDVYSGTARIQNQPGHTIPNGHRARLEPFQMEPNMPDRPDWVKRAFEAAREIE